MTENSILIETSFADAIAMIAAAQELPEQIRRHWATSMRQIAKAFDKPAEVILHHSANNPVGDALQVGDGKLLESGAIKAHEAASGGEPQVTVGRLRNADYGIIRKALIRLPRPFEPVAAGTGRTAGGGRPEQQEDTREQPGAD